ncbi:YjfI family protein [Arenicella sp. 4NH20-0111]|uniref:YjfI family protein n=1 Tax=Arenicella sp. 4NH20-0111 TaxID=3127648 RepID=UPI00310AA065
MTKKSSAEYQREYRRRLRDKGLVKKEVWVLPENSKLLHEVEKELRTPIVGIETQPLNLETPYSQHVETPTGGHNMHNKNAHRWTTESLYGALKDRPAFSNGSCTIEIIEGLDSSIVIGMHEYGDLPIFISVGGEQILVEAVLFCAEDISDTTQFNEYVLKTHKYLPLSTISLDTDDTHGDYYHMFGALSSASSINEVVLEVETLAENVIQATEAFSCFLKFEIAS